MFGRLLRNVMSHRGRYTFYASSRHASCVHDNTGLYLHVPFCNSICPYCPYYKVHYDANLASNFRDAVTAEIDLYARGPGGRRFSSLYIGGGTPTLMLEGLRKVIDHVRDALTLEGYIAIETTPADVNDQKSRLLRSAGVSYVSLGVQSFQKDHLGALGRNYGPPEARRAALGLSEGGFAKFNIDLIFALPNETLRELEADLTAAIQCRPDQITCYPLFTFPYTTIGRFRRMQRLQMPPLNVRRKMYYVIHDVLEGNGYKRSSVWSFTRTGEPPYSSVTRDYYIGLGPGAASYTGEGFYFNTFSLPEYIRTIPQGKAVALRMDVTERMAKLFWLYWRLYETRIPYSKYREVFRTSIHHDFGSVLAAIRLLGMCSLEDEQGMVLNRRGCHWVHLAQNYFALDYVNKIWTTCQADPWPEWVML